MPATLRFSDPTTRNPTAISRNLKPSLSANPKGVATLTLCRELEFWIFGAGFFVGYGEADTTATELVKYGDQAY